MRKKTKQYLVVGLGAFGSSIAETLMKQGMEVLGIDSNPTYVDAMRDVITQAICADVGDEEVMRSLGLEEFDTAFIAMSSDIKASCVITMMLKELGVRNIIAKAQDDFHARMLTKLGADRIVYPERAAGKRLAMNTLSGHIMEYIELCADFSMLEIVAHEKWWGKALGELKLRDRLNINVVAIRRGDVFNPMPKADTCIEQDDILLVVTAEENMPNLQRYEGGH